MAASDVKQKDFTVRNGLIVNANNYGENRLTVNGSVMFFGNTTSSITINSSAFAVGALVFNSSFKPANAALADNTSFVGSTSAANVVSNAQLQANLANYLTTASATATYQTTAGLTGNVATRTANNATFAYGKTEINLNVNNSLTANLSTFSGTAAAVGNNGSATGASFNFIYAPQVGSPTYVWGTIDGANFRPYSITQITSLGVGTSASGTTGEIRATNNITAYFSSDERLKTNIETLTNALEKVKSIRGVSFDWKDEYIHDHGGEDGYFIRKRDVGVIAQDIEKVLPEVVVDRMDGTKAVKYDRIIALLIEAVKELSEKIES